jgi:hypothetical protein
MRWGVGCDRWLTGTAIDADEYIYDSDAIIGHTWRSGSSCCSGYATGAHIGASGVEVEQYGMVSFFVCFFEGEVKSKVGEVYQRRSVWSIVAFWSDVASYASHDTCGGQGQGRSVAVYSHQTSPIACQGHGLEAVRSMMCGHGDLTLLQYDDSYTIYGPNKPQREGL